ncbi:hypothetical protein HQ37_07455 [Porphyromonas sp. COT-239 OH1446]|nr:threonine/serine exporter family protein [Porphyromonas sp. COT-239 OH1446]KGN67672.1 hypothetical protein HQ37_07455 [Porphyromonas sp. COT-239 OH1446]
MSLDLLAILEDGLFAAIAAIGFAAVSNPPRKSFIYVPILAALGHMFRFVLMSYLSFEIAVASFFAAMLTGFVGIFFAYKARYPSEVFSFPALLPMIPGMFAYRSLLGMIQFMRTTDEALRGEYLNVILSNAITAAFVMISLGIGVAIPIFIFYRQSFRMTRAREEERR